MTPRLRTGLLRSAALAGAIVLGGGVLSACGGSDEASTGNFCDAYAALDAAADEGPAGLFNADLDQLVDAAPTDDLRQAAETVRDTLESVDGIDVDNLDVTDPEAMAQVESALEQVFTPEFSAAADQIDDYAGANCEGDSGS